MGRVIGAAHCYQEAGRIDQFHLSTLPSRGVSTRHGYGCRRCLLCSYQPGEMTAALLATIDFAYACLERNLAIPIASEIRPQHALQSIHQKMTQGRNRSHDATSSTVTTTPFVRRPIIVDDHHTLAGSRELLSNAATATPRRRTSSS
ncbi:hypothetical protein PMIN06_012111 [Paraphaeosphaeria minitans]